MPETDDSIIPGADHEPRIRALEALGTEYVTTRRLVAVALGAVLTGMLSLGGVTVTVIQAYTRLDRLERDVHEHAQLPTHAGTLSTIGDIRSDIRALALEVRQNGEVNAASMADLRTRLDRLEQRARFAPR